MYSLAVAHVPDSFDLASLAETNVTLAKAEPDQKSVICLTRLHKAAKFYPDYFCSQKGRQITLQHMVHWTAAAGVASNFARCRTPLSSFHLRPGCDIFQAAARDTTTVAPEN